MSKLATVANRLHVACCYIAQRHRIKPPPACPPGLEPKKLAFECIQYIHFLERPELAYMRKYHQDHIKTTVDEA